MGTVGDPVTGAEYSNYSQRTGVRNSAPLPHHCPLQGESYGAIGRTDDGQYSSNPFTLLRLSFQIGNLANDGVKLATKTPSRCSADPHDGLEEESKGGTVRYFSIKSVTSVPISRHDIPWIRYTQQGNLDTRRTQFRIPAYCDGAVSADTPPIARVQNDPDRAFAER